MHCHTVLMMSNILLRKFPLFLLYPQCSGLFLLYWSSCGKLDGWRFLDDGMRLSTINRGCVFFSGNRRADRNQTVPPGAEWEKQGEMVPGDPDHEEVSAARTHPSHLQLCHCFPNCLTSSSASSASVKTDQIKRLKDRRGKHVDCPCVFQLSAQSTDWCDQRYEIQRTPSVIENGCTVRPWIFPGAGENTCSFMFAPTFHQSTALWLETNVTHVNRIIFFKLKGRTVSHTFRPRWRCVRQPWPAGEDLPAESFLPEAQRRRSCVHGDQTFLDLHLKLFHSFLPLWCHLWIPSFVSICFCLVFVVTTKTLWCFTIRLPVLVQGFRDSAGGASHDKLTGRVWHWGF